MVSKLVDIKKIKLKFELLIFEELKIIHKSSRVSHLRFNNFGIGTDGWAVFDHHIAFLIKYLSIFEIWNYHHHIHCSDCVCNMIDN